MCKLIPYAWAINIYDIDVDFYKKIGIKYILLDLDNTLDCHKQKTPSKRALELIKTFKENGLIPIIVSNNKESRVKKYADACGCEYLFHCRKPFKKKINNYLISMNIDKNNVIMIGDQLMTDIRCAKRLGVKSILLEKLWPNDQFVTKLLRWLDYLKRSQLRRRKLLINWRDIYGRIK